jgi:hypothetical protein
MMTYILDNKHNPVPCGITEWGTWMTDIANKIVKQEYVGEIWVSTVFLGVDHNFTHSKDPILFETILFDHRFPIGYVYQDRCSTWNEALEMHDRAVLEAKRLQGLK